METATEPGCRRYVLILPGVPRGPARAGVFSAPPWSNGTHFAARQLPSVRRRPQSCSFYALSQASRAISAARIRDQPWRSRGHGLRVEVPENPDEPLGETVVLPDPKADSTFRLLCQTTGSVPLTAPTRLGALWAVEPHAERVEGLGMDDVPSVGLNLIDGAGDEPPTSVIIGSDLVPGLSDKAEAAEFQVREWLKRYPRARGPMRFAESPRGNRGVELRITWLGEGGEPRPLADIAPPLSGPPLLASRWAEAILDATH